MRNKRGMSRWAGVGGVSALTLVAYGAGGSLAAVAFLSFACSRSEASPSRKVDPAPASVQAPSGAAVELASHKVESKNFKLEAVAFGECKANDECRVDIRLEALDDYHVNKEYPYKFKAEAKGDVEVEFLGTDENGKNVFSKKAGNFETQGDKKATMKVRFKPLKVGQVSLSGTYKLSVCSAQNCQLESQQLALNVVVK